MMQNHLTWQILKYSLPMFAESKIAWWLSILAGLDLVCGPMLCMAVRGLPFLFFSCALILIFFLSVTEINVFWDNISVMYHFILFDQHMMFLILFNTPEISKKLWKEEYWIWCMTSKQFEMVQYIDIISKHFNFCHTQRENQYQCKLKN